MALFNPKNEQLGTPDMGTSESGQRCFGAQEAREVAHGDQGSSRGTSHAPSEAVQCGPGKESLPHIAKTSGCGSIV